MTIKKLMMGAGAIDEPQVIAPSSNDWDMSLGIFTFSGNTLGNHTVGGTVHAFQAKENFSSLITLDGDFIISFTLEDRDLMTFGVHGLESDGDRTNTDHNGQYYFSTDNTGFWWGIDYGSSGTKAMIKGTAEGSFTAPANGSTIIIRRESGTITLEDDGSVLHTYSETYSAPMRFGGGSDTHGLDASLKNLFITDTEKVQRDSFLYANKHAGTLGFGDAIAGAKHVGMPWTATRTGNVSEVNIDMASVTTSMNMHVEIWNSDGTNPSTQSGDDSNTHNMTSSGINNITFSGNTPVVKGGKYWVIYVDEGTTGNSQVASTDYATDGSKNDVITSMADGGYLNLLNEIVIDTSAGEPTPDHDTLLLIKSDTSDGSQTFVDSSQFSRTITVVGNSQHDTAQQKFGASAMYFDGTGDYIHVPNSTDWQFQGDGSFTIDFWMKTTNGGRDYLVTKGASGAWSAIEIDFRMDGSGDVEAQISNNGSTGIQLNGTTGVADGSWHHIALVRAGTRFDLYIDGTSEDNETSSLTILNLNTTYAIGADSNGSNNFTGHLDEIRISNVARWDANFTPPTSAYP